MRKKGTDILAMSGIIFPTIEGKGICRLTTSIAAINPHSVYRIISHSSVVLENHYIFYHKLPM